MQDQDNITQTQPNPQDEDNDLLLEKNPLLDIDLNFRSYAAKKNLSVGSKKRKR